MFVERVGEDGKSEQYSYYGIHSFVYLINIVFICCVILYVSFLEQPPKSGCGWSHVGLA